jgi:hypothetical protein
MTSLWKVPAVVAMFLAWFSAPPATLGEAARREALRRQLTPKSAQAFTNADLPAFVPEVVTSTGAAAGEAAAAAAAPPTQPPPVDDEDKVAATKPEGEQPPKRDEAWWRARIAKARAELQADQAKQAELQARIVLLTTQAVNRDDPAQQQKLFADRQMALQEIEKLIQKVAADEKAIADILEEARREGVPAGWLR